MLKTLLQDKRFFLNLLVLILIALSFWLGSRYPALSEKAQMGGDSGIHGIGFDQIHEVDEFDPIWKQVFWNTANWIETNKKGMLFGLLFAASISLAIRLLPQKNFQGVWSNTLLGIGIGTPLGVCVNCVAPIAKSMHRSGSRIETTLATMFSSPSMNIIVLTMLFSLLPWYYAITKIGLTLCFLLLILPLLSRHIFSKLQLKAPQNPDPSCYIPSINLSDEKENTWRTTVSWFFKNYFKELGIIIYRTVPLMLLAGFLGALAITLLPWDNLSSFLPSKGYFFIFLGMIGLTLICTFLPVPIAFDVIIVTVLLAAGIQSHYAMVILFTLGLYSIYSAFIINKEISRTVSVSLFGIVAFLGVTSGVIVHFLEQWELDKQKAYLLAEFNKMPPPPHPMIHTQKALSDQELQTLFQQHPSVTSLAKKKTSNLMIHEVIPFQSPQKSNSSTLFTKKKSSHFGFDIPYRLSFDEFIWFHAEQTRAIASGDVHNDGWPDLLISLDNYEGGFALFTNLSGKKFVRQSINLGELTHQVTRVIALVDFNNDGWLDIFFATHLAGNYILYNQCGSFEKSEPRKIPSKTFAHVNAAAFGDINKDGLIDIILGYWSVGYRKKGVGLKPSQNQILFQQKDGTFEATNLPGYPAETHSVLLTDFNNDHHLDLIVGNDFRPSDIYYTGNGDGTFTSIKKSDQLIPETPTTTMSITSADLNNDLQPELFATQISRSEDQHSLALLPIEDLWTQFDSLEQQQQSRKEAKISQLRLKIARNANPLFAYQAADHQHRVEALALAYYTRLQKQKDKELQRSLNIKWKKVRGALARLNQPKYPYSPEELQESIPQKKKENVLLVRNKTGAWENQTKHTGLRFSDWSWSSRFADFNHDELQDLYVVNGYKTTSTRASNVYFENQGNLKFINKTEPSGLTDFLATTAATYIDYDNDGDLDIVTVPTEGPVHFFTNNSTNSNAIKFELRDSQQNHFGIGAKIIIHYGKGGKLHQMRELQMGGGYLSFDAPVFHFGLGEHQEIDRIKIQWPDGKSNQLQGPFQANHLYRIKR